MSTKFTVTYSEQKDINIYLNALWQEKFISFGQNRYEQAKKYFPIEFLDNLKNAPDLEKAEEVVKNYWQQSRMESFDKNSKIFSLWFTRFINKEQSLITERLEKAYGKKFPFSNIDVYLTTYISCPYNYDNLYYMVNINSSFYRLIETSVHELNHFMFYYYLRDNLQKLNYSNIAIEHLKETFAVLTSNNPSNENAEKIDVLPLQDFVYQNKDKPVDKIIELVIKNKLLENIK